MIDIHLYDVEDYNEILDWLYTNIGNPVDKWSFRFEELCDPPQTMLESPEYKLLFSDGSAYPIKYHVFSFNNISDATRFKLRFK